MNWIELAFISTTAYAVAAILQRVLLKDEQHELVAYAFYFPLIVSMLIFIYALATGFRLPPLVPLIPYLILMSVLYAFANLLLFKALQMVEVSEIAVIASSKSIWTVITAVIFLGEIVTIYRVIGILLVTGGVIVISWKKGLKFQKGHLYAMGASIFFGVAFTNDAFLVREFNSVPTLKTLAFLLPSIVIFLLNPSAVIHTKLFTRGKSTLLKLLLASIIYAIAAVTVFLAYQAGGYASQLAPIIQSSVILTVIFAYIFLRERQKVIYKMVGIVLVSGGVLLLKG